MFAIASASVGPITLSSDSSDYGKAALFKFRADYRNFLGVLMFRMFTVYRTLWYRYTIKILKIKTPKKCCNYPKIGTVSFYYRVMGSKDADRMANSVDPHQTAPLSSLIWVYTVCPGLSFRKFRIFMVYLIGEQNMHVEGVSGGAR